MVWLTGGSMVMAVLMVVGLLVLVFSYGLSTFWPIPITKVVTRDGLPFMGEITRLEWYRPQPDFLDRLPESQRDEIGRVVKEQDGMAHRRLFRTGNFRQTQTHFQWVDDFLVAEESTPEWAVIMEMLEWGRFYGFPMAFARILPLPDQQSDGSDYTLEQRKLVAAQQAGELGAAEGGAIKLIGRLAGQNQESLLEVHELGNAVAISGVARVWEGSDEAWRQFQKHHGEVRKQWKHRRRLEKHAIGEINARQEDARLGLTTAELDLQVAERRFGPDSDARHAAAARLEQKQAEYAAAKTRAEAEYRTIRREIDDIHAGNGRYRLVMQTPGEGSLPPQTVLMRLDDIVRAYPANRLSMAGKLGVYLSRWWEFLSDEPREANSEGGVFPAIFGTMVMTFVMIIIVVPFGVLAALYLREYAKAGPIVSAVRIAVNNLAGVPSIVFGVFGLGFFCYGVGSFLDGGSSGEWSLSRWTTVTLAWSVALVAGVLFSHLALSRVTTHSPRGLRVAKGLFLTLWVGALLAGAFLLLAEMPFFDGFFRARLPNPTYGKGGLLWAALTLALLTLPVVIVAAEEALSAVPNSMREGSYACGASKWQTIKRIVLPRAMPGIMTGTVLAMARGAGEVAPLMLVGAVKLAPELPIDSVFPYLHPERSFMHLGFHIYDVGFQSQNSEAAKPMVYTTTMLLILLVVAMNLVAIYLRNRLRRKFVSQAF